MNRVGQIDAIIFSGDLVQKGDAREYEQFDEIVEEILTAFDGLQNRPPIVTVPGNHDMSRPPSLASEALALKQFWSSAELQQGFWDDAGKPYREFLDQVFENYVSWQERAIERGVHAVPQTRGPLPGDAAYLINTPGGDFGVVGLNATWLQLGAGDYKGELHVDARQLLAVTGGKPDEWARANSASLVVTHQPANWLKEGKPATWQNDINPAGRFDAHVFGHMHEPDTEASRHGGSPGKINMQAAALFGLEKYGDGQLDRIQGYSANQIEHLGSDRRLTSWPRRLIMTKSKRLKLDRDTELDLNEDTGSFSIVYQVEGSGSTPILVAPSVAVPFVTPALELAPTTAFDLAIIRLAMAASRAHKNVRRVEQETCVHALTSEKIAWIAADWGMGFEGFICSVRDKFSVPQDNVFSLDFSSYRRRESFFDTLQTRLNATLQQIGDELAGVGPAIMILDDVDLIVSQKATIEAEIEDLARTLADFANQAFIIVRSRKRPRFTQLDIVELIALDEADVAIYASESEIGGRQYGKPDAASQLLRHTDGVPTRLDDALRDLEIVSLRDLVSANPDFGDTGGSLTGAPSALVASVQELRQSQDRAEQRAYMLLLALAALPQGEQLVRLKRFLGVHPFGALHARELLNRSLIAGVGITTGDATSDATGKALVVPRPVRDYVRESMDPEEARAIDVKALALYFGDNWSSGNIRNSPTGRRARGSLCDGYEIQNAATLILRSGRRAFDSKISLEIDAAIRLASAFIECLMDGNHFRAAANLCEDMVHLLEDHVGYEKQLTIVKYEYGRSLRMSGRPTEARDVFLKLDTSHLTKSQKQLASLCLALSHEILGEDDDAATVAKRTITIDRRSNNALQAKTIIAKLISDDDAREEALKKHLKTAESKNALTIVNNIRLDLAKDRRIRGEDSSDELKEIVQSAKAKGDYYNSARAIVDLASLPGAEISMSPDERSRLVEAYHFLYNERLFNLFDRCHGALWRIFEHDGDRANLLNLFRRSSFIWRLNGRAGEESKYLSKLMKIVHDLIAIGITQVDRDGAYFVVRVTVVTGKALADLSRQADEQS